MKLVEKGGQYKLDWDSGKSLTKEGLNLKEVKLVTIGDVGGPSFSVTNLPVEGMIEAGRGLVAHLGDGFSGYGRLEALVVAYYE